MLHEFPVLIFLVYFVSTLLEFFIIIHLKRGRRHNEYLLLCFQPFCDGDGRAGLPRTETMEQENTAIRRIFGHVVADNFLVRHRGKRRIIVSLARRGRIGIIEVIRIRCICVCNKSNEFLSVCQVISICLDACGTNVGCFTQTFIDRCIANLDIALRSSFDHIRRFFSKPFGRRFALLNKFYFDFKLSNDLESGGWR